MVDSLVRPAVLLSGERCLSEVNPCSAQAAVEQSYNLVGAQCTGDLFVPFMFLMFNGGDLLGRGLASVGPWAERPPAPGILLTYALGRVALLVGLMFCNVITPHPWRLPRLIGSVTLINISTSWLGIVIVNVARMLDEPPVCVGHEELSHTAMDVCYRSDAASLTLNLALGVTNGHLASLACMHAPSLLPPAVRDRCAGVLSFAIVAGITAGSVASLILIAALQR